MLEAEWCWYRCKQDIADSIQSVENQVGQEEEPAKEFNNFILSNVSDAHVLTSIFRVQRSSFHYIINACTAS